MKYQVNFSDVGREKRSFSVPINVIETWDDLTPEDGDRLATIARREGRLMSQDVSLGVSTSDPMSGTVFAGMHPVGKWSAESHP